MKKENGRLFPIKATVRVYLKRRTMIGFIKAGKILKYFAGRVAVDYLLCQGNKNKDKSGMMKSQNSCQKNTKKYIEWTVEILVTLVFMLFINIRYPGTVFADDGFEVQDGVLVGYSGTGGEVEIPEDVVKISGSAFQGNNTIIHVYMGDSVRELDTGAFASCSNLVTIQLSNNLTRIETLAFHNCENLKEIAFPESLSYIGACAFRGCNNLVSVWIPSGVNTIDYGAFSGCKRLKSIGSDAGNKNFTSISDVLYSEDKKIICQYPEGRTETSYHVLSGVDTIERDAFLDCSNLTSITLPVSVTRILPFAFYNCTNLEDISIPSSMHEIGESSFSYCTSLKLLSIPENVTTIGQDAFANCDLQLTGKVGSTAENYAKDNNIIFIEDNDQLIESISNEQISNESTINDGSESITASETALAQFRQKHYRETRTALQV